MLISSLVSLRVKKQLHEEKRCLAEGGLRPDLHHCTRPEHTWSPGGDDRPSLPPLSHLTWGCAAPRRAWSLSPGQGGERRRPEGTPHPYRPCPALLQLSARPRDRLRAQGGARWPRRGPPRSRLGRREGPRCPARPGPPRGPVCGPARGVQAYAPGMT